MKSWTIRIMGSLLSLSTAIAIAAALVLGLLGVHAALAASGNHSITYDHDCYTVDGQDVYMYSGSIHYMRCPKELWADRMLKIKRAGINTVQTIIPWNYHEPEEGKLDLTELDEWLTLCESLGLYVNLRPGPYICGEWDNGGFPDWLVPKGILLRTNDEEYLKWVEYWFDRVMRVIRRHQVTQGGCVFLVQLENEYGGGVEHKREVKSTMSHQTVGDPALVLINGRYVPEASGWHARTIALDAAGYLRPNENVVEVILEKNGRPCGAGDWGMNEPKGLASVALVGPPEKPGIKVIDHWRLNVGLHGQAQGYFQPDYDAREWQQVALGDWKKTVPGAEDFDGIGWYRLEFDGRVPAGWTIPLKLWLKAQTDALIYLNGHIVGRYHGIGWQREFYLPDCWLNPSGKNVIAIAVRNAGKAGGLEAASVRPYREFSVRRHAIDIRF